MAQQGIVGPSEPQLDYIERNLYRQLMAVEAAARDLIKTGLRLTPNGLIVVEKANKTDPHWALCEALEAIAPLNPKKL